MIERLIVKVLSADSKGGYEATEWVRSLLPWVLLPATVPSRRIFWYRNNNPRRP